MPDSSALAVTSSLRVTPSAFRAWGVLVAHSFLRHWRIRQMGWVSLGLLALVVGWVAIVSARPGGWELQDRRMRRGMPTYRQAADRLLPHNRYDWKANPPLREHETPSPLNPTRDAIQSLILSIPHAAFQSEKFVKDWGFMNFSRWVILGAFLTFVLPLFTLAYATSAFGSERELRSLVWIMTRPIPRAGIYLAKFLGTLPWCVLFGLGGFAGLCLAGGEYGRKALAMYWPAAVIATIAFSALFHLVGAIFRRPVVVGLVYVFFFEALVGTLPGSLKLLSLTFYGRCLMYNAAEAAGYPVEMFDIPEVVTSTTAWAVLGGAALLITGLGMWLFSRTESRDDI